MQAKTFDGKFEVVEFDLWNWPFVKCECDIYTFGCVNLDFVVPCSLIKVDEVRITTKYAIVYFSDLGSIEKKLIRGGSFHIALKRLSKGLRHSLVEIELIAIPKL